MAKPKPTIVLPKKKEDTKGRSESNLTRRYALIVFIAACLVYANTLFHDFTLDDAIVIYDNEFTCKGLAGVPGLLKYDTFRGFFKVEGKENLVAGGRYRPLTPLMFAAEVELFAPKKRDANGEIVKDRDGHTVFDPYENGRRNAVKFIGHLVNVILYAFTCLLLFGVLLMVFQRSSQPVLNHQQAVLVALAAALLFTVHPIHTEAVANVKGRDEIISLLNSLAALYLSFRAFIRKKPLLGVLAGWLFFLALLSKENAITFLAIVPLTFYYFSNAKWKDIFILTIPYLIAAGVFLILRGNILGWSLASETPRELMNNPFLKLVGNQYVDFTTTERIATILFTLGKYVLLLIWPHPLSHDYYPKAIPMMTFENWQTWLSLLVYVAMTVYALVRLPKKDPVGYGILFYIATLSIASNLVFPIGTNMSERFVYMPSVGFALVCAVLFYKLSTRLPALQKALQYAGIALILILAIMTVKRNFAWKDNFTLFMTDVVTMPNSAKLRNAAGGELIAQAIKPENAARKNEMLKEALGHLKVAVTLHPGYKNAFLLIGNANNYLQEYEASVQAYQTALKLDPYYQEAKNNLQITYRDAGRYFGEQKGDLNTALSYLLKAYDMKSDDYETLRLLGVAYGISGQATKAIEFFQKALELLPDDADAMFNLATAYINAGQRENAIPLIEKAKSIKPNIEEERRMRQ